MPLLSFSLPFLISFLHHHRGWVGCVGCASRPADAGPVERADHRARGVGARTAVQRLHLQDGAGDPAGGLRPHLDVPRVQELPHLVRGHKAQLVRGVVPVDLELLQQRGEAGVRGDVVPGAGPRKHARVHKPVVARPLREVPGVQRPHEHPVVLHRPVLQPRSERRPEQRVRSVQDHHLHTLLVVHVHQRVGLEVAGEVDHLRDVRVVLCEEGVQHHCEVPHGVRAVVPAWDGLVVEVVPSDDVSQGKVLPVVEVPHGLGRPRVAVEGEVDVARQRRVARDAPRAGVGGCDQRVLADVRVVEDDGHAAELGVALHVLHEVDCAVQQALRRLCKVGAVPHGLKTLEVEVRSLHAGKDDVARGRQVQRLQLPRVEEVGVPDRGVHADVDDDRVPGRVRLPVVRHLGALQLGTHHVQELRVRVHAEVLIALRRALQVLSEAQGRVRHHLQQRHAGCRGRSHRRRTALVDGRLLHRGDRRRQRDVVHGVCGGGCHREGDGEEHGDCVRQSRRVNEVQIL
eukprot:Rhum_TRINITY_DN15279_c8_g1::Rhum_TRINITY_DN15279_c8_g1_i1::g.147702::m.147702